MTTPSSVIIDSGDTFRLRNDHPTEDLVLVHKKRSFKVQPGKSALVPFEIIRIWWGDPRSRPGEFRKFSDSLESGYVNKREAEIARLGVMYGSYVADVDSLNDPNWPLGDDRHGIVPKRTPWPVSIMTEAGDEVIPACFDRGTEAIYGLVANDSEDLNDQVQYREHLEKQMDEMREKLRRLEGIGLPDDAEVDSGGR